MRGLRVVIPATLKSRVLAELHSGHQGIVRMKLLARSYIWWPGLDADIEHVAANCTECQRNKNSPANNIHPWQWPSTPWNRIHLDFAGPFMGSYFIVLADSHSKWLEVVPVKKITAKVTIEELRLIFARFGLPNTLVTDNGTTFVSDEFQQFLLANGIKHLRTAPYHPQSNGLAERAVQIAKQALRKMANECGSLNAKLAKFLLNYRRKPHATTNESPSHLLFNRQIRSRLDLLVPNVASNVRSKQEKTIADSNKSYFEPSQKVAVKMFGNQKWKFGEILERTRNSMYTIRVGDDVLTRCVGQLRALGDSIPLDTSEPLIPTFVSSEAEKPDTPDTEATAANNSDEQLATASNDNELADFASKDEKQTSQADFASNTEQTVKPRRGRGPAKNYGPLTRRSERIQAQNASKQ